MNMRIWTVLCPLLFLAAPGTQAQELETLPLHEIETGGWMKEQMLRDITSGYISEYENMQPSMKYDSFGARKTRNYVIDDLGNWIASMASWWPGEHEGYYADDVIRNAFLTGHAAWKEKAASLVDHVLKHQSADGYIGIYEEDCRLDKLVNDNGELWTQSRMLVALLAYYEYTGDKRCLDAVIRAADHTIASYRTSGESYFQQPQPSGGGLTHGLMYVDVLEWLYKLTGEAKYADFAEWLYLDYSRASNLKQDDMQLDKLLDDRQMYEEHSVHVVEHMRAPLFLSAVKSDPRYATAVKNMFSKYHRSQSPSGVVVMDPIIHESVGGNYGSPYLPYEYCSIVETVISFSSALQKSGFARLGDEIERVAFNAGQGARLSDGSAISYATIDNRIRACESDGFRYQIAACHKVACCNLQAPKLLPYYVANMWMKSTDGTSLYAMLYGESTVTTTLAGERITVRETTLYPFENTVSFEITTGRAHSFPLFFRNPGWSKHTEVICPGAEIEYTDNGYIKVSKVWKSGDRIQLSFDAPITITRFMNNEFYLSKGALLYALEIASEKTPTKTFEEGFANYDVVPAAGSDGESLFNKIRIPGNADIKFRTNTTLYRYENNPNADKRYPYDTPYGYIKGRFVIDGKVMESTLVPMGSTVLRRLTFKEHDRK